ncbi:MAG: PD40 domain-containing protein, partial [Flavobacteriales bacterium]|nr:PD40 domain-containing protein [Flavobacteriales bacterium]
MKNKSKKILSLLLLIGTFNMALGQISVRILDKDIDLEITKLDQLNSTYEEANLSITPSGKYIFYQSERPGGPDANIYEASNGKLRYDANIWYSKKTATGWAKPKTINAPAGSSSNEDEPMVSPDGKTVAFQSWRRGWELSGGPYYVSQLYGETWGSPKGMGSGINDFFVDMSEIDGNGTDGAAISPDGKKFVFAWGKDYYGKLDLYMSTKNSNGTWSYPKKMKISTPGDERSVFFGSDSKTLFFSSDGYKGFGGLDIYKTIIDDKGSSKEVLNLGEKFNT